tara:strand:- start:24546 stop:26042 length:1497 start_codon:yes stop_codon:yes gene_type:complete
MAINFIKYVDITSGVGAGASVARVEPILRIISSNTMIPTSTVVEFNSASEVGLYFGTSSEEYKRASFYFSFVSKSITSPNKISFYKYNSTDSNALIFGGKTQKVLTDFTAISDARFNLEIGGVTNLISTDLANATSLAEVALLIQTQIQLVTDTQFATATVSYNATRGSFDLVSGDASTATISVSSSLNGTDIVNILEWNASAIFSDGLSEKTITETLDNTVNVSSNFITFLFTHTFTIDSKLEVAKWVKLQNNRHLYLTSTNYDDAQAHYDDLNIYGGVDVILASIVSNEYHEMMPACIAASTDYYKVNSVKNYMYQQASLTPSVTETTQSNFLDSLRINYYGQTQTAGQNISFYQRGNLMGLAVDPSYENILVNEAWFKGSCGSALIELQLALEQIPWNASGAGQISLTLQNIIEEALKNGVISVGKPLTNTQKLYIGVIANDDNAYRNVEEQGFWLNVELTSETVNGVVEYLANYTIIYSKSDSINKITGSHILI